MKIALILSLVVILSSCGRVTKKQICLEKHGLRGQVKELREIIYEVRDNDGIPAKEVSKHQSFHYNESGNTTAIVFYNADGDTVDIAEYLYNEKKQHVNTVQINLANSLKNETSFLYNRQGFVIESVHLYDGELTHRNDLFYDNRGNLKAEITTSSGGLYIHRIYEYDESNQRVKEAYFTARDNMLDYSGFLHVNKYNDSGIIQKKELYLTLVDEDYVSTDMGIVNITMFEYDTHNSLIQETDYSPDDNLVRSVKTYQYEYDDHKNWIAKSFFEDDVLISLSERFITYYE